MAVGVAILVGLVMWAVFKTVLAVLIGLAIVATTVYVIRDSRRL